MEDLQYPLGRFSAPKDVNAHQRMEWMQAIANLPEALETAVNGLNDVQFDTPYRPGGWTVRQVVHHLADSHLNNYIRVRFALTENKPTIMPYDEAAWAELADARSSPADLSLALLYGLHARWATLLAGLAPADFEREYVHPASGTMTLHTNCALYAWHGRHHVAHITELRRRMGW